MLMGLAYHGLLSMHHLCYIEAIRNAEDAGKSTTTLGIMWYFA